MITKMLADQDVTTRQLEVKLEQLKDMEKNVDDSSGKLAKALDEKASYDAAESKKQEQFLEGAVDLLKKAEDGTGFAVKETAYLEEYQDRKIIHRAELNLEVEAYEATYAKLTEIVKAEKGFIAGADTQRLANNKIRATVTLRIPPDRFEATIAQLRALGTVRHQSIGSEDVSKAYVDLEARLGAKQALVDRLKKILAEAKGNVKELMEVEVQMGRTIEEIEQIKGELKYFDNMVGLTTIVLQIAEKDLGQPFEFVETLQSNIGLTARDPDAAYRDAQKVIADAGGQVIDARMNRQSDGSSQGSIRGKVDAEKFPAVREALKKLGQVDLDTASQQRSAQGGQGASKPDAPVRKEQAVIDVTVSSPKEVFTRTANVRVEAREVENAYHAARRAIESAGGKIVSGALTGEADGAGATVHGELDADKFTALVEELKGAGKVLGASVQLTLPPAGASLVRERAQIHLHLSSPEELIADEHGLGRTIRDTFAHSVEGILWSIKNLFVGISLAAPWIVLLLVAWFVYRRAKRAKAAAAK